MSLLSQESEESLKESLVAHRDSSPLAGVQNDKIISLAGSQVCHSEGARSATEESLPESLVTHRDSSPVSQALDMTTGWNLLEIQVAMIHRKPKAILRLRLVMTIGLGLSRGFVKRVSS